MSPVLLDPPIELVRFETDVIQTISRTRDVKSIRFKKPERFNYLPGQWISVTLRNEDALMTKPLSLSSSPTEEFLEVTKRLTGHEFSNAIAVQRVGDKAILEGPFGNLIFQENYDKIGMLSGGIGIAPLRSMIRYSTDKDLKSDIALIYSNRYEDSVPFEDDFKEMQTSNPNFKLIITITKPSPNWKGSKGRINQKMIKETIPDYADRFFYTCGPMPMVDAMKALLFQIGLKEKQIKFEYFTGYLGVPNGGTKSAK